MPCCRSFACLVALVACVAADPPVATAKPASTLDIPTMTLLGRHTQKLTVAQADYFDDEGALCHDPSEGDINEMVTEDGDFGGINRPGTYHIIYSCTNNHGRDAVPLTRTVIVKGVFEPGASARRSFAPRTTILC